MKKICMYIPKTNTIKFFDRNYDKFLMAHIEQIGMRYVDGMCCLGDSVRVEVEKDKFKIITNKNNEIIYQIFD